MNLAPGELQQEIVKVSELIVMQESVLQRLTQQGRPTGPSHDLLNSLIRRRMDLVTAAINVLRERHNAVCTA